MSVGLVTGASLLAPLRADAAVHYQFQQQGPVQLTNATGTFPVAAQVRFAVAVDDALLAPGGGLGINHGTIGEASGIDIRNNGIPSFFLDVVRTDRPSPQRIGMILPTSLTFARLASWSIGLAGDGTGRLTGSVWWADDDTDRGIRFTIAPNGWLTGNIDGAYGLYAPGAMTDPDVAEAAGCFTTGACTFQGRLQPVPPPMDVPEPASTAAFLIGLLGLGYSLRRNAA